MPAQVSCPNPACARVFGVPDGANGKKIQCPFCKKIVLVPPLSTAHSTQAAAHSPKAVSAIKHQALATAQAVAANAGKTSPTAIPAVIASAKPPGAKTGGFRLLLFAAGGLIGCVLTAAALGVLGSVLGLFEANVSRRSDQELAAELARQKQQAADALHKADEDAALIADLREALAKSNRPTTSDQSPVLQLRDRLKAAEAAALKSEAAVSELKAQIQDAETRAAQKTAALKKLAEADLLQAKEDKAALDKALAQLREAEKKAHRDGTMLAAMRERLKVSGAKRGDFEYIDKHALATPPEVEKSLDALADYLASAAIDDTEIARAIYRWVKNRIEYDREMLLPDKRGDQSPEGVLKTRKAVCEGMARVFAELANQVGLKTVYIVGKVKQWAPPGQKPSIKLHAWNAVFLEGKWQLVDPTGTSIKPKVDAKIKRGGDDVQKKADEFYFLSPPDQFVFFHFPEDPKWQLTDVPMTSEEFDQLPAVPHSVWQLGVSVDSVRAQLREIANKGIVKASDIPEKSTKFLSGPLLSRLEPGKEYYFKFQSEDFMKFAAIQGSNYHFFQRSGNEFQLTVRPQKGMLAIAGFKTTESKDWMGFLVYEVE